VLFDPGEHCRKAGKRQKEATVTAGTGLYWAVWRYGWDRGGSWLTGRGRTHAHMMMGTLCPWHLRLVEPSAVSQHADLAECRLIQHPKTSGTLRRSAVNHKVLVPLIRLGVTATKVLAHLSTNFEKSPRRHDAPPHKHSHPHPRLSDWPVG